jgi:hypothetical protein
MQVRGKALAASVAVALSVLASAERPPARKTPPWKRSSAARPVVPKRGPFAEGPLFLS